MLIIATIALFISTYLYAPMDIDKNKYPYLYNIYENVYNISTRIELISSVILIMVAVFSMVLCMICHFIIWKNNKIKE